jgi:5-methylcytosine-specific restriction endonuclease McrA
VVEGGRNYDLGQMAHVIAQSPAGPRGNSAGGGDAYDNLILLCPTCHREIDKTPSGVFSGFLLHSWKKEHEERIRNIGLE